MPAPSVRPELMVALTVAALMSMPEVPSVSVPPLPMTIGSVAPAPTARPNQLDVPAVRPAPSDDVDQFATSPAPGATLPDQLAPAVKSVPVVALVIEAAKAVGRL